MRTKLIIFWAYMVCFLWVVNATAQNNSVGVGQQADTLAIRTLPEAGFKKVIADKTVQLIDVRTPDEYKQGHIKRAVNIDVKNAAFDTEIRKLNPGLPVAVYCRSGGRSKIAAGKLAAMGFQVFELEKGINGWTGEVVKY